MVSGAIVGLGTLAIIVGGIIFFRDDIGKFFEGLNPIKPAEEAIKGVGKEVFDAGVETRKLVDTQILKLNIQAKDSEITKQAKQAGFESRAERQIVEDAGQVVIGSSKNVVNFGLIGDVFPTNPSDEFRKNPELFLSKEQLNRFGGKSNIGTMSTKTFSKRRFNR